MTSYIFYKRNIPTGLSIFAMSPLGTATDWNFRAWTLLCPLYTILCCSPGSEIGRTVSSTNPKQLSMAAPLPAMAAQQRTVQEIQDWAQQDSTEWCGGHLLKKGGKIANNCFTAVVILIANFFSKSYIKNHCQTLFKKKSRDQKQRDMFWYYMSLSHAMLDLRDPGVQCEKWKISYCAQ